ncbi:MAG: ANTAR domain-containing protein, partial [Streptomyces sp.]|nr:ANTAR domain-containing protein [Streptomyces sp.]
MCHARSVSSEPVLPPEHGGAVETAATSAVLERAKGAIMALTGCSADAAVEELSQRAKAGHRTLIEQCWITLGGLVPRPPRALGEPAAGPGGGAHSPDPPVTRDPSGV